MAQWIRRLTSNQKIVGSSPIVVDLLFFFASRFFPHVLSIYTVNSPKPDTVNFAYNDTRRGIRKVSLVAKCRYTRSPIYVLQLDGTLLRAWKFCRYSRIVVISAVVISQVDCTLIFYFFYFFILC